MNTEKLSDHSLQTAINELLADHPDLSIHGWHGNPDVPEHHPARYLPSGVEAYQREPIAGDRERISVENVRTALSFLDNTASFRKTVDTRIGSYSLKHQAEKWGAQNNMSKYVSNGEFIVAALLAGFEFKRSWGSGPNCNFNIRFARTDRHFKF